MPVDEEVDDMGLFGKEKYAYVFIQINKQPDGGIGIVPSGFIEGEKRVWGRNFNEDVRLYAEYYNRFCRKYPWRKNDPTWMCYGTVDKNKRFDCLERFHIKQENGKIFIARDESVWDKFAIERIDAIDSNDRNQILKMRILVYPKGK